jgi:dTDP-4-dehydrorhamnose 3,5-epimerase
MEFIQTDLEGVILIYPRVITDERGFFLESYKQSEFTKNGIKESFIQDNHSKSTYGVLRGLHYQLNPLAQGKLIRCVEGTIFDVAVDIRIGSPTFGRWVGYELSAENKSMLYIPTGFAHGFLTISPEAQLLYKTTNEYSVAHDRGIKYNDPSIGIIWPKLNIDFILSTKDKNLPLLTDAEL